jgi:hypothetical protein
MVGIAIDDRVPTRSKTFSLLHSDQTGSEAHLSSYPMDNPKGKVAGERS